MWCVHVARQVRVIHDWPYFGRVFFGDQEEVGDESGLLCGFDDVCLEEPVNRFRVNEGLL